MKTRSRLIAEMWNSSLPRGVGAGVDQRADIGVARRDHAIEGRVDLLVGLQIFEALDVGGGGIDDGLLRVHVADDVVGILPRDSAFLFAD